MFLSVICRLPRFIPGKLLVVAWMPALAVSAQTYSPTPATAGTPITFSSGAPGDTNIEAIGFSISGPKPGDTAGTSANVQAVNGTASFTATLPAGLYELEIDTSLQSSPTQFADYYFTVYGPNGSDLSALQGRYVFHLSGTSGLQPAYALGSFNADGNGNITAGVVDINSPGGVLQAVPVTGTYQLNASGTGTITLNAPQGTLQFSLVAPSLLSTAATLIMYGLPNAPLPPSAYLSGASLVASAGGLISGNGTIQQIMSPDLGYPPQIVEPGLSGSFNTTFSGGALNTSGSTTSLAGASQFGFTYGATAANSVTSQGTLAANGATLDYAGLAGTYAAFDTTTGRTTMTLPTAGGAPPEPFALYQFNNGTSFYFLSLTSREASGHVLAGRGDQP